VEIKDKFDKFKPGKGDKHANLQDVVNQTLRRADAEMTEEISGPNAPAVIKISNLDNNDFNDHASGETQATFPANQ
jgi:hypothetical protein